MSRSVARVKTLRLGSLAACLSMMTASGCTTIIRTADRPVKMQELMAATPDAVWSALSATVQELSGTIVSEDRASGLMTYRHPSRKRRVTIYVNVHLQPSSQQPGSTMVYVVPRAEHGLSSEPVEWEVFEAIRRHLATGASHAP